MASEDLLRRPLDANSNRIVNLGTPTAANDATHTDNTTAPQAGGTASAGTSLLASPADHVHPASGASTNWDFLLTNDPASPTISYTPVYSSNQLVSETWKNVAVQTIKQVFYSYTSNLVTGQNVIVYDPATATIMAEVTYTFSYTGSVLNSYSMTRDIGAPSSPTIDTLLENDPVAVGINYAITYGSELGSLETWTPAGGNLLKSIAFTYASNLLATEVRKVFDSSGTVIIGQITQSFTYVSSVLQTTSQTRDL